MAYWRRRSRAPALVNTQAILHTIFATWLGMPPDLEATVVGALIASRYSRPVDLKRHCAVIQSMPTDLDAFFATTMTPTFAVALFEDLHHEQLLTRQQASAAQEHVLAAVDAAGQWKNNDPGPQAA